MSRVGATPDSGFWSLLSSYSFLISCNCLGLLFLLRYLEDPWEVQRIMLPLPVGREPMSHLKRIRPRDEIVRGEEKERKMDRHSPGGWGCPKDRRHTSIFSHLLLPALQLPYERRKITWWVDLCESCLEIGMVNDDGVWSNWMNRRYILRTNLCYLSKGVKTTLLFGRTSWNKAASSRINELL